MLNSVFVCLGVRTDGNSIHFFHRPARAYTKGTRKRRKVQPGEDTGSKTEMRWHKTGRTRPVIENGKQLGCKKIMVLYITSCKKSRAEKTNWVMHQYHLGVQEEEKEGEYVVSKIFYQTQPRQCGSGFGRREDGDGSDHLVAEMTEQQGCSYHNSSPSTVSNSINSPAALLNSPMCTSSPVALPPNTPMPFQGQTSKQHKGLLATITEDVEKLQASISGHSYSTMQSSDQSNLVFGYTSMGSSCKSDSILQESAYCSAQSSPENGEKDVCCSNGGSPGQGLDLQNYCSAPLAVVMESSLMNGEPDEPMLSSKLISETIDPEILKFLSSENLDVTLRLQRSFDVVNDDGAHHTKHHASGRDVNLKEVAQKSDSVLENIILDTPPDFLLESFLNSQETGDWLGKKKFWSDSSQKTDDGNFLDFLRDSQSSV
ncbi:hypothetical protein KP509_34G025600 [Ceratopteris richardii]|uniref:NAC domain-containing protein n=1 Tax=Ceratopteris richardii TaxID=49495 RepID=A0A8T2QJK8_CERRI|nr:hypothetical protein KP509_34G025600 [Ceratopteris richardii]